MFGPYPERGKVITWLPKLTVNGKPVSPVVTLKKTRPIYWEVSVAAPYRAAIYNWLYDVCGS